jgi:hypothetical protein
MDLCLSFDATLCVGRFLPLRMAQALNVKQIKAQILPKSATRRGGYVMYILDILPHLSQSNDMSFNSTPSTSIVFLDG